MMKIGVQTGGVEEAHGIDGAYRIIHEAGFDAADANIDHLYSYQAIVNHQSVPAFDASDKDCLEYFRPWKEAAEKYGVDNYQAHAPFPSYILDESGEQNDYMIQVLKKCIIGCDYMNCRRLIIHPFFLGYHEQLDPQTEWDVNIERYSRLIPEAKKYGVILCLENMFTAYWGKIYSACCSDIDVACRYIDTLNEIAGQKCFGFCLDTGHLLLLGKDVKNAMVQLGDRIEAFHVHDNNGVNDQHLAPYMGVLDWNRFVEGLRAIRYDKTLSFETFNIWNTIDKELCPEHMRLIAQAGRMFARRAAE